MQTPRDVFESRWSTLDEIGRPTWIPLLDGRKIASFDIETDTSPLTEEEKERFGEDAFRGLDPRIGGVTAASISTSGGETYRLASGADGEVDTLRWLDTEAKKLAHLGYVISGWNSSGFDGPFIKHRSEIHRLRHGIKVTGQMIEHPMRDREWLPFPVNFHWWGMTHVDLYWALLPMMRRNEGLPKKLKPFGRQFGLDPIEVDASKMHLLTPEELAAYVTSDTRTTRIIGESFQRRR